MTHLRWCLSFRVETLELHKLSLNGKSRDWIRTALISRVQAPQNLEDGKRFINMGSKVLDSLLLTVTHIKSSQKQPKTAKMAWTR